MTFPQIKVLMVAINNYPIKSHQLSGCERDLKCFKKYLEDYQDTSNAQLDIKVLLGDQATRENIISNFLSHFKELKNGDIGVFYFSGHGSQVAASSEFHHNTPNHKHESIVCYDSRLEGGLDLADKELAWLIWKISAGKKINFTGIFDCCHSGSIFRKLEDNESNGVLPFGAKTLLNQNEIRPLNSFLGYEDYHIDGGNITVPKGNYAQLSACRSNEYAIEKIIDIKSRGVFTHCLLQSLKEAKEKLSLFGLYQSTKAKLSKYSEKQHPQIHVTDNADLHRLFLGGTMRSIPKYTFVYYHREKGWIIDLGSVHGLHEDGNQSAGYLKIFDANCQEQDLSNPNSIIKEVQINQVFAAYSTILNMSDLDTSIQYRATYSFSISGIRSVYISDISGRKLQEKLQKKIKNEFSTSLNILGQPIEADIKIHFSERGFEVSTIENEPIFILYIISSADNIIESVFTTLSMILEWFRIRQYSNSETDLENDFIRFRFFKVLKTDKKNIKVFDEKLIAPTKKLQLSYGDTCIEGVSNTIKKEPMFRLQLENIFDETLWICALYLSADFSVSNTLLPKEELEAGQKVWLEYPNSKNFRSSIIPVNLPKSLFDNGIRKVTEYFKILICSEEFDSNFLNQKGIYHEYGIDDGKRSLGKEVDIRLSSLSVWKSFIIPLHIHR